jgi:hypothetical protein
LRGTADAILKDADFNLGEDIQVDLGRMSALESLVEVGQPNYDVRFVSESRHQLDIAPCPLSTVATK